MTFLEQLQAHKGGLIHLKTQLCWFMGRGWDNNVGRVCLILDAAANILPADAGTRTATARSVAARLLIDGAAHWVWIAEQDVELLVNDQPIS